MKLLLTLMFTVFTLFAANAKDAAFALDFEDNYQTALDKAKKENKPLMLLIVRDPCPYCDGSGQIKSPSTVCYEAFREVRRSCRRNTKGSVAIFLHSDVFKYIQEEEQEAVKSLEDEVGRSISIKLSDELHREQFELYEY